MPRKLIAANWKENPKTEKQALELFRATAQITHSKKVEVVVAPPFVYIERFAREKKKSVVLGAQDVFWEEKGPFTSEVGPKMLRAMGVKYVIIGHSERRKWLKETDTMINKKVKAALADKLTVILCVGESLTVRKKGEQAAKTFVEKQLTADLRGISRNKMASRLVVAYEPVWAIGTGRYDQPEDAASTISTIKSFLKKKHGISARVLYGGSVNGKNIGDYVQYKSIDGALVGGASLKSGEFKKIIKTVDNIK